MRGSLVYNRSLSLSPPLPYDVFKFPKSEDGKSHSLSLYVELPAFDARGVKEDVHGVATKRQRPCPPGWVP